MAAQLPDSIIINGSPMDLYSNPLEEYWVKTKKQRPHFYKLISCQRGYVATWEIKEMQLFLNEISGSYIKRILFFAHKKIRYSTVILFPRSKGKPVKANWFTGKLRIPSGPMTMYEHSGYDSRFEKEIIITVDKGNILKTVSLDYTHQRLTTHPSDILR